MAYVTNNCLIKILQYCQSITFFEPKTSGGGNMTDLGGSVSPEYPGGVPADDFLLSGIDLSGGISSQEFDEVAARQL